MFIAPPLKLPAAFRQVGFFSGDSEAGVEPVGAMAVSLGMAAVFQVLRKRFFERTVSFVELAPAFP
jgi:hypothetical protein